METESVLFNPHGEEINIHYLTRVNGESIYQINTHDCIRYISFDDSNIEHIGFVYGNKLHIFRLVDGEIPDELKSQFFHIDEEKINILCNEITPPEFQKTRKDLVKYLDHIPKFRYLRDYEITCRNFIDLHEAKNAIVQLNDILHQKCPGYSLNIDYIFRLSDPSFVSTFSTRPEANTLLLCLFTGNNCVSSLELEVNICNNSYIGISSKTNKLYEKRKYNKLLRAIIIIIAKLIHPSMKFIESAAINPVSGYLMLKGFNGVYKNNQTGKELNKQSIYEEIKEEVDSEDGIIIKVELNDENIANANKVFEEIIENINCDPIAGEDVIAKGKKTKRKRSRRHKTKRRRHK